MYKGLAQIVSKKIRLRYKKLLEYAGLSINADKFIGFILSFVLVLSIGLALICGSFLRIPLLGLFLSFFIVIHILIHMLLMLKADAKGHFVNNILPDALQLMASNLKAGLTTDKAILLSARPEFGPFSKELNIIGKEITMGKNISKALLGMSERIKSEKLKKTILLITSGLESGGELAELLSHCAKNLRSQQIIEEKTKASVTMYVIFIFSALALGAPVLFGLSSFLVEILTKNLNSFNIPAETAAQFPVMISEITLPPEFIMTFIIVTLITISILGSLILGLIKNNQEREGIKYIPILLILTLSIFFLVRLIILNLFGSLFF